MSGEWDDPATRQRIEEVGREMERNRRAREAEEAARPTPQVFVINVAVAMAMAGEREIRKLPGDPKATKWGPDSRALLEKEIGRVEAVLDRLRSWPDDEAITPERLGGGS